MSEQVLGLRERKKQLTRASIADATLQLALDKGLEQVTIDDIARTAFVSPRTVSNYFSCKEEAIAAAGRNLADTIAEDLALRPAEESALGALHEVTLAFINSLSPDELEAQRQKRRLGERYPAVQAYLTARYETAEELALPEVAARTSTGVDDTYPWLVAAAAVAAVRVTATRWARSDGGLEELLQMTDDVFSDLRRGLEARSAAERTEAAS